jgi:hypothetical protein
MALSLLAMAAVFGLATICPKEGRDGVRVRSRGPVDAAKERRKEQDSGGDGREWPNMNLNRAAGPPGGEAKARITVAETCCSRVEK